MQGGCSIQKHGVIFGNFFQDVEYFRRPSIKHVFGTLDVGRNTPGYHFPQNKRLEHFESHFFGKSALGKLKFGSDYNNGTARIVDTFTQKVLSESALLSLKHV